MKALRLGLSLLLLAAFEVPPAAFRAPAPCAACCCCCGCGGHMACCPMRGMCSLTSCDGHQRAAEVPSLPPAEVAASTAVPAPAPGGCLIAPSHIVALPLSPDLPDPPPRLFG